jgi:hypothetical protein
MTPESQIVQSGIRRNQGWLLASGFFLLAPAFFLRHSIFDLRTSTTIYESV